MELEPIDPETAFELYIAEKETSVADATVASHKSRLSFLLRWCAERDIENLNELTGRRLQEFRLWRRNVGDLTKVSEKTQMDTLRVFVKWLEQYRAVDLGLLSRTATREIRGLYDDNRTDSYYGGKRPTENQADRMYALSRSVHQYITDQIREGCVCVCDTR